MIARVGGRAAVARRLATGLSILLAAGACGGKKAELSSAGGSGRTANGGSSGIAGSGATVGAPMMVGTSGAPGTSAGAGAGGGGGGDAETPGSAGALGVATPGSDGPSGVGTSGSGGALGSGGMGGDCPTSIEGVVYDPSGQLPLANAWVYVPSAAPAALANGATGLPCSAESPAAPLALTSSNARGEFSLSGVPAGSGVPLVVQVGKWRRQTTIPSVTACTSNSVDAELTRLPRSQAEGDLPRIAVTTGASDALECMFSKLGIAASEFSTDAGAGRIHLYRGGEVGGDEGAGAVQFSAALGGAAFPHATTLWSDPAKLLGYDLLVMSCEGAQYRDVKEPYYGNLQAFVDGGGRVLSSHLQVPWLNQHAYFQNTASYIGVSEDLGEIIALVDTSSPKGVAFNEWLVHVGAALTSQELQISGGQHSVSAVTAPTRRWLYVPNVPDPLTGEEAVQLMTIDTPLAAPAATQCGRVTFSDIHVSAGANDASDPFTPFPEACSNTLTPQIRAIAYMLFESSGCL